MSAVEVTTRRRPAPVRTVTGRRALRVGPFSTAWRPYTFTVTLLLAVATAIAFAANIGHGDYPVSIPDVFAVFTGGGDHTQRLVILDWRLSRTTLGLLVGAALGVAGALTQSVARNPLASPDVLGITEGASAAAVTVIVLGAEPSLRGVFSSATLPVAALAGGLLTAAAIYVLAWRRGLDPFRLVLIGIAIGAMLTSVVSAMMVRADLATAAQAKVWLVGSLSNQPWSQVWPLAVVLGLALALLSTASFDLGAMRLGDDSASALGVPLQLRQATLLIVAVVLTSVAVAAAGPVAFVAFVAPQLALRLVRSPGPPIVASALTGALLVLVGDLVARTVLPWELPVGIVTAGIGGPFLLYMLIRANATGGGRTVRSAGRRRAGGPDGLPHRSDPHTTDPAMPTGGM